MTRQEAIDKVYGMIGTAEQHEALEFLVPEIRELREFYDRQQEDERIKKWLYDYISNCPNDNFAFYGGVGKDAVLNYLEKQKEQKPILEVFGFKVGDKVRLKDGDGRTHIIKKFEKIEGIHGPDFYHVEFEDNSARDGIYPGEEYPNGYYTQMEKFEEEQKPEWRLTEFQNAIRVMITEALTTHIKDGNGREMSSTVFIDDDTAIPLSEGLLELAKNELAKRDEVITLDKLPPYDKGFQDGKAEAMADLERTYLCNPDKLPKWLKDDIARKELNAHTKGYNKGYKDAEKQYNESVAYHYPEPVPPGVAYKSPKCYTDVMITPNTNSGTSTLKAEG